MHHGICWNQVKRIGDELEGTGLANEKRSIGDYIECAHVLLVVA